MLFERASFGPIRMPAVGQYYETEPMAFGAKMTLARWRAQMLRSTDIPRSFATLLRTIQFKGPYQHKEGWFFTIEPLSSNPTIESVKEVVGETMQPDEFWRQFE
jgi:CBS-domain-containing membrane protein